MTRTRISQNFRSQNDPPLVVVLKRPSMEPKEISTRWWSNMCRSETAFCTGIGSWRVSFWIPIIYSIPEGLFVKYIDWPLLCIEQHSDNLRIITLQMIWNVLSGYEQTPGIAALKCKRSIWYPGQNWRKSGWWCHVLMTCVMTYRYSWTQYCWLLKVIIIYGKRTSKSYHNSWCHW